ncbi:MAG: hypothetical protein IPH88_05835 [Bacteroidales bacterium]|nr:hypothetical protein [Bacteroidales bacterium]
MYQGQSLGYFKLHLVINANNLNLYGTAKLNSGGYFTGMPNYGTSATLIYNTGSTYGRGVEWSTTNPKNIQISNSTILNYPNGSNPGAKSISGNLTMDAGSACTWIMVELVLMAL